MARDSRLGLCVLCLFISHAALVATQCTKVSDCSCKSDQGTIDLSGISGSPPFQDQMDDGGAWMYSYSPCTPFTEGDGECSNVAVCQVSADMSETYPCGTVDSSDFGADSDGNVQITYKSTDSAGTDRTTVVTLKCDDSGGGDVLEVTGEDPSTQGTYLMTLTSASCCPSSGPGPGPTPPGGGGGGATGLSIGSILCIVLIALLVVYIAAGIALQKGVRKASGKEVLPNYGFWSAVPGLIKDGVLFTVRGCKGGRSGYDKV